MWGPVECWEQGNLYEKGNKAIFIKKGALSELFAHLEEAEGKISGELSGVFDEEKAVRTALQKCLYISPPDF